MMRQGKHGAKMQKLTLQNSQADTTPGRVEIRSGLNYSELSNQILTEENIDHRIRRCQHPRLRAALQFNNQAAQAKVVSNIAPQKAPESPRTSPSDGEIGTGAKALIKVTRVVYNCVNFLMSPI